MRRKLKTLELRVQMEKSSTPNLAQSFKRRKLTIPGMLGIPW